MLRTVFESNDTKITELDEEMKLDRKTVLK